MTDAVLGSKNLDHLIRSDLIQNIIYLKLPRNNLSNHGIANLIALGSRLSHVKKLDLSSN